MEVLLPMLVCGATVALCFVGTGVICAIIYFPFVRFVKRWMDKYMTNVDWGRDDE